MANIKSPTPGNEAFILEDAELDRENPLIKLDDGSTWVHKVFTGGLMVPGDGQMLFTRDVDGKSETKNAQEWYEAGNPIAPDVQSLQVVNYGGIVFKYQVELKGGCPDPYNKFTWIFNDQTDSIGGEYHLSYKVARTKNHTVVYHSSEPIIYKIDWLYNID